MGEWGLGAGACTPSCAGGSAMVLLVLPETERGIHSLQLALAVLVMDLLSSTQRPTTLQKRRVVDARRRIILLSLHSLHC